MAYVLPTSAATGEIGRLRTIVAKYFPVYELRVTPQSLILAVQSDPATLHDKFDELRQELWPANYIATIRKEGGETVVEVLRRPARTSWRPVTNIVLLAVTAITCLFAGAFLWVSYVGGTGLNSSAFLWGGITFTLPLMAILGFHELAHFVVARYRHVDASLPFFMPMPPPFIPFGTMGAVISLREPIPDRRALLEIGAAGPIMGFALAVPITLAGLFLTSHYPVTLPLSNCGPVFVSVPYGDLIFGSSLLYYGLGLFFPIGALASLNPLAIAGWIGLLVTAINLLPAGQLDGGHVFRALFGPKAVWVSWVAVGSLFVLGLEYPGWWLFGIFILFLGARHPPPLNDLTPLDLKHQLIGVGAIAILVIGFVAIPLGTPTGDFAANGPSSELSGIGNEGARTFLDLNYSLVNQDLGVPHGFVVNATVTPTNLTVNEITYLQSDLWTLSWNHGPTLQVPGSAGHGDFNMPNGTYISLNGSGIPGSKTDFTLQFQDPSPAQGLTFTVTVSEICRSTWQLEGGPPVSATYTYTSS